MQLIEEDLKYLKLLFKILKMYSNNIISSVKFNVFDLKLDLNNTY